MLKHEDNAVTPVGGVLRQLAGISVTVTDKVTGLPASLYKDDEITPIPQPLTTDNNGYYGFKAPDGTYLLTFSGQRIATFTREIVLDDPKDDPYVTLNSLAAATGSALVSYANKGTPLTVEQQLDLLAAEWIDPCNPRFAGGAKSGNSVDNGSMFAALTAYIGTIALDSRPVVVHFAPGVYKYSSGLAFTRPVKLIAHGATLNYTGTGKAVQLGPDGIANFDVFLQGEYTVDGLRFTGGANATHGIYINDYVIEPRIRNVTFEDFGNAASHDIFSQFQVWDVLIENCRKLTYSSTTAVGNFISITGRNKANTADDGGNSRVTIRDCWMTSYSNQDLGYFAYVNAVESCIVGGGFQRSRGGVVLGPQSHGTTIDRVYAELSTATKATYITVMSDGASTSPRNVRVKNAYINLHPEVIGTNGKMIVAGDATAKMTGWTVEDVTVSGSSASQVLITQNDIAGQGGNTYRGIKTYSPADGQFSLRGSYTNAETWTSFDAMSGTWTPTLGADETFAARSARFTKNGNVVTVAGDIQVNQLNTGSGSKIYGLPYPCGNVTGSGTVSYFNTLTQAVVSLTIRVDAGANYLQLTGLTAAATGTPGGLAVLGNGSRVIFTATYHTAA